MTKSGLTQYAWEGHANINGIHGNIIHIDEDY